MRLLLLAALLLAPLAVHAQEMPRWADTPSQQSPPPPPQRQAPPTLPGDPPPVPVDGGLALLALVGAGYAARRLRQRG